MIKKVLFITSSSIKGGAQKHIRDMFLSLSQMNITVYLVAPNGWLVNELMTYKDRLFVVDASFKNIKKLEVILDKIQPDIVNTFILSGAVFGYKAWLKRKYGKIFITVNNPVIYDGITIIKKIIYPHLYRWMARNCSAFLIKSSMVREEVNKIINGNKPAIAIKNGIDFQIFNKNGNYKDLRMELEIPNDAIVISNVGALDKRKGQVYLIDAVAKLLQDNKNIYLLIAGEGDERRNLEIQIEKLGISQNAMLIGARSDINRILYYSNIFVLPSLHEGLPNALMEAMAMGLCCISTDVGGARELISDSNMGFIIETKSSESIKRAIQVCLVNRSEMKIMAINAHEKIRNQYELGGVVNELVKIYNDY